MLIETRGVDIHSSADPFPWQLYQLYEQMDNLGLGIVEENLDKVTAEAVRLVAEGGSHYCET
jgi:hypothetical protein